VLIVGASVGIGAAVGAGFGAFAGGIGALPGGTIGAAVGNQVGMWILGALGLKALAEFFIDGLPGILRSYYDGFTLAWHAGYDDVSGDFSHEGHEQYGRLQIAAARLADGHVAMVMLLLSAVVAYLARGRGDVQVLAREARGGRLGEEFANWLVKNEAKLRDHPNLKPRAQRPSGAGGEPPAPPPQKPRRGEDEEPHGPRRMMRKRVRCFKADGLHWSRIPEFDRQLKGQESGLNDMTVEEYIKGRQAFEHTDAVRDPRVARAARTQYEKDLSTHLTRQLRTEGLSRGEATQQAAKMAADKMKTLVALHNPDMVAGGKDAIGGFGDRSVNSSIGAQWNSGKPNRLVDLDSAAMAVQESQRSTTKMNAQLERCK